MTDEDLVNELEAIKKEEDFDEIIAEIIVDILPDSDRVDLASLVKEVNIRINGRMIDTVVSSSNGQNE